MSGKTPKSLEFCEMDDDGNVSDLALHASILDDDKDLKERAEAESTDPGPGLNEADEEDISDIDDIVDLLDVLADEEDDDHI